MKLIGVLVTLGLLASTSALPYGGGRPRRPRPSVNQVARLPASTSLLPLQSPPKLDVSLQSFEVRDSLPDEKTPMSVFVAQPPTKIDEPIDHVFNFELLKLDSAGADTSLKIAPPASVVTSAPSTIFEIPEESPVSINNIVEIREDEPAVLYETTAEEETVVETVEKPEETYITPNESPVEEVSIVEIVEEPEVLYETPVGDGEIRLEDVIEEVLFENGGQLPIEDLFIVENAEGKIREAVTVEEISLTDNIEIPENEIIFIVDNPVADVIEVIDPPQTTFEIPLTNDAPPSSGFSAIKEKDVITQSSSIFASPQSIADLPLGDTLPLDMKMMPHIPEIRQEAPEENIKEEEVDTVLPYGKPGENTVCPLCVKWTSSGLEYDPHGEPPPNAIFWGDLPETPSSSPSESYGLPNIAPPALPSRPSYDNVRGADLSSPPPGDWGPVKSEDILLSAEEIANLPPPAAPTVPYHVVSAFGLENHSGTAHPVKKPFKISNFLYNIFLKG